MAASDRPMILCGPIVRRATADQGISVFVVTRAPCELTLVVAQGATAVAQGQPCALGRRRTARIGRDLHLAVVTARPVNAGLRWGETYHYDVRISADGFTGGLQRLGTLVTGAWDRSTALDRVLLQTNEGLPSVCLPPADPAALRLLTGSCRKPHGTGSDGLALADTLALEALLGGQPRPHQLVLSGDQIYADDVDLHVLGAAIHLGDDLLGDGERRRLGARYGARLAPDARKALVRGEGGLTTTARGHLISFAEFCAMYLLAWSPVVWPEDLAQRAESKAVKGFHDTLRQARRALANMSTYMIFDDHEITDDWGLRARWNAAALSTDLGRRVIRNGLAAYALFQHWGNRPEDFEGQGPGAALLALLDGVDGGVDEARLAELDRLLG
ncbi:MAG: hypothetical protein KC613_24455, partial [Myxococcales bacterium]|nr:hypothetical protein [Myxococcales bacterium]